VVVGSSANPGLRDFAIVAAMVAGRQTDDAVSFDVNRTQLAADVPAQLPRPVRHDGGLGLAVLAGDRRPTMLVPKSW